jgi:hypothetical protein
MKNKKGFLYKKYLWWKFDGKYIIPNIIDGIKNIIKWFPIIWKDRDYDHSYIFDILKNKLSNQKNYLFKRNHFTSSQRECEIINTCINLIDKINTDYYNMEWSDYHTSSHEWLDILEGEYANKGYKEMKSTLISENFDEYFAKYKLVYLKIKKLNPNDEKMSLAIKISHKNHKRCKKLLFSILENNIENWWD